METYGKDFLTPLFVICISEHHHHRVGRPKGPEDSTMGGIDRQILQRERLKMKLKEEKKIRPDEKEGGGHYSSGAQDSTDAVLTGDGKRLSPKDIADLVSQSTSKSANNPFAKGIYVYIYTYQFIYTYIYIYIYTLHIYIYTAYMNV
jgi:hypothetical protein